MSVHLCPSCGAAGRSLPSLVLRCFRSDCPVREAIRAEQREPGRAQPVLQDDREESAA